MIECQQGKIKQCLLSGETAEEINLAISRLKTGSSPGSDGFTCEWYNSKGNTSTLTIENL